MLRYLAIAGTTAATLMAAPLAEAQESNISLLSGPFGTGTYVLSSAAEQIVSSQSETVRLTASETPGLVYNAKRMNKSPEMKENNIMAFTTGVDYLARTGQGPFDEKLPGTQLIGNYLLGSVWLATFDPDIRTIADLEGKTIALGRPPQILWTIEPMQLLETGLGAAETMTIERLGTKQAAQALLNGSVDAAIIGGYADPISGTFKPSPQTVELMASGKQLYHIPWGKKAVQNVIDSGGAMSHLVVPAGAVDGLDQDLESFFDAIAWVAYPEFDEEAAYEITRLIIENVGSFGEYHALGQLMSPESLASGWSVEDIHPGALRAYREAGVIE